MFFDDLITRILVWVMLHYFFGVANIACGLRLDILSAFLIYISKRQNGGSSN